MLVKAQMLEHQGAAFTPLCINSYAFSIQCVSTVIQTWVSAVNKNTWSLLSEKAEEVKHMLRYLQHFEISCIMMKALRPCLRNYQRE